MSGDNLVNYLKTNFALMHHHGWDMEYIDSLPPFERTIYVEMLSDYLEEQKKKRQGG
jgi:hypothetical protein